MYGFRPLLLLLAAPAASQDPADLLPADTLVAAEAQDLSLTMQRLLSGEPCRRFRAGVLGARLAGSADFQALLLGVRSLAAGAGAEPMEILEALAGGGAAAGLLPGAPNPAVVVVLKAVDPSLAQDAVNSLLTLVTQGGTRVDGIRWRIPLERAVLQRREEFFFIASTAAALDRLAAEPGRSLTAGAGFQAGRAAMRNADVRIWVGSGLLDHARQKARLDRLRDAGASLFFGGIAAVAGQADWAVAGLSVGPGGLRLHAAAPAGTEALRESHGPFFPGLEEAELPQVEDTLATFVLPRVLGPWWTSRDLYLTPEAVSSSVEADTNLTTVFQRDFGTEVLHRLAPGLRVVVARAPFLGDRPAVEFPAAALGLRARPEAAEEMAAGFYNAFSIVINLTNFDRPAMGDQRLQMAEPELQEDGARIYSARYAGAAPGALLPPRYNLSPALLLRPDGEIWISSSLPLLRRIAAAPRDKVPVQGDRLRVDLRPGRAIFAADRDALLARKVLQQGGDVQAAGAELDALAAGLELFDSAALDARLGAGLFQLELSLEAGRDEETGR